LARNRTLRRVGIYSLLYGCYAALASLKEVSFYKDWFDQPANLHAAFSAFLMLLLVFRTNASFSRWWEARTLWGALVNACRNLSVKINAIPGIDPADLETSRELIVLFPAVLRDHLRQRSGPTLSEVQPADSATVAHLPSETVQRLYILLDRWRTAGRIDGHQLQLLDREASRLLDICGGCERIRNTRMIHSYRAFARQCVTLLLIFFPWGIADEYLWWSIPTSILMAYFMLGLETVAEHVEEPFGYDEDDLDLDGLCETISRSVAQIYRRRTALTGTG
jgi:putative membrane protein